MHWILHLTTSDVMQVIQTGRNTTEVVEARSPGLRQRELGTVLRALRTEMRLTVEQVADSLLCSPSKVSRLETGQRGASSRDVRDLGNLYQVDPAQCEHLQRLASQGRSQGWWESYAFSSETHIPLEAEAAETNDFEPGVFPGLLQTSDYARPIHRAAMPILDEAILHRPVGNAGVMSAQTDRLIEASQLPNVTIRALLSEVGAYSVLGSTFILLEFEDFLPGGVSVGEQVGHLYLQRPQDVQRYRQVFERLRTTSLDAQKSLDLMSSRRVSCLRI